MNIRQTELADLEKVMPLYDYARELMRQQGNTTQWIDGYPSTTLITEEIINHHSFVCLDENGEIMATFCFILGEDPTYKVIYDGAWLNDEPYGVIHRMATSGKQKGIGQQCINWCFERCKTIRVDTHQDNLLMQHVLEKQGFIRCGIILVANGTERIAFQKSL